MTRHAKASSAASDSGRRNLFKTFSLGVLVGLVVLLAISPSAVAAITHPYTGVSFGPDGTEETAFSRVQSVAIDPSTEDVYVYDGGGSGTVYKFDAAGSPVDFSSLSGNAIEAVGGRGGAENQIAIAPPGSPGGTAGDIFAANANGVRIYDQSGTQIGELTGGEPCGVATDPAGHILVGVYPNEVREYVPAANPPTNADQSGVSAGVVENVCNVAADGLGNVYAARFFGGVQKLEGLGAPSASLIDPSGRTLGIDPATNDLYADSESAIRQYDSTGKFLSSSGEGRLSGSRGVAVNGGSEEIYVGNAATNRVEIFGPAAPLSGQIEDEGVTSVDLREALLHARINPNGNPTTYHVEYGLDASYGNSTEEAEVGADETVHTVTAHLIGLTPRTTYHYRFVVSNAIGVVTGPDRTFTTTSPTSTETGCPNQQFRVGASAHLPDCRAYEMVSPIEKNNTDIARLLNGGVNTFAQLNQSATSGEKLAYTTLQGFGDTEGTPYVSQYIAARTGDGWSSSSIVPPQGISRQPPTRRIDLEYQVFSDDLCQSLLNHYTDPPLAPGATEGVPNVYRRTNCGQPQYETVSTATPGNEFPALIQGLSADARCAVYSPDEPIGLYENCAGQIHQVNILPNGEASIIATAGTSPSGGQELTLREGSYQGAVSADGSRIYWTPGFEGSTPLYLRENTQAPQSALGPANECLEPEKACTIPVSDESARAYFWGASPDGARAFYTVETGGERGRELYEFDLDAQTSTLVAGKVSGVMGVNQEATRIYFVSREELSGNGVAGKPNLYLFDETKSGSAQHQFVGTVSEDDALFSEFKRVSLADRRPFHRVARLSPDGLHAVFSAYAPLTGYDNTDAVSGERDFEVFAFDAQGNGGEGSLHCISCNPTGQRPVGRNMEVEGASPSIPNWAAAFIPGQDTSFYASRAVSEDGSHVFFNSYDSLLPADTNGKEDVYEWQAPGAEAGPGKCTEESASYSSANGGCLSLISSGESPSDSEFLDASPTGRDVFFTTAASLLPQDPGLVDIYDARVGGGFPPPPSRAAACEGEACQGPYSPPNDPTPASSSFEGAGNVREPSNSRCTKGEARRKGRCVAKKKKHAKKGRAHRAAKSNGRAAR